MVKTYRHGTDHLQVWTCTAKTKHRQSCDIWAGFLIVQPQFTDCQSSCPPAASNNSASIFSVSTQSRASTPFTFWSSSFLGTEMSSESHSSNCTLERSVINDNRNQHFSFSMYIIIYIVVSHYMRVIWGNSLWSASLIGLSMGQRLAVLFTQSKWWTLEWTSDNHSAFSMQPPQYTYTQCTMQSSFTHFPDSRRTFKPSGGICRVTYTRGKVDISFCVVLVRPSAIFSWETEICWSRRSAVRPRHIAMDG